MGIDQKILVRAGGLCASVASVMSLAALLAGCGQKGILYLPNDPEFQQRATLPEIVRRQLPGNNATTPATPAPSPAVSPAPSPASSASAPAGGR
jgi:predicted small lipoprotein YifL